MPPSSSPFLSSAAPVPIDRPFTTSWARSQGVDPRRLRGWVRSGHLVAPLHGVLYAAQLEATLRLRIECLRLVIPPDAVVTDRTAAWLHGAPMVLPPGAHTSVPAVDVHLLPGSRIRRAVTQSGQRQLLAQEIEEVDGIRVTTHLRTMCDLGRRLPRKQAFGAMCMLMKVVAFTLDDIREQAYVRFRGHRWVCQLRQLFPLLDPRFESPGECSLALIWHETPGLPAFEPQFQVSARQRTARLDLAAPGLLYGAEYDGADFHGADRHEPDLARRRWLEDLGWQISVFTSEDVRGSGLMASNRLFRDIAEARRTYGVRVSGRVVT